ncbi:UNVERIFIED_CONTAM: hypothetical protein RMT77_005041 [Armadillidium vulgare]
MLSRCGISNSLVEWSLRSGRKVIGWFGLIFSITGPIAAVILFPANFHILQVIVGSLLNMIFSILLIIAMEKENIQLLKMWILYRKSTIVLNTLVYIVLNITYIEKESVLYIILFDISYIISQLFNIYCIYVVKAFSDELSSKAKLHQLKKGQFINNNNNIIIV